MVRTVTVVVPVAFVVVLENADDNTPDLNLRSYAASIVDACIAEEPESHIRNYLVPEYGMIVQDEKQPGVGTQAVALQIEDDCDSDD